MKYYKVKKESDQVQCWTNNTKLGGWKLFCTLIGGELFTEKELTSRAGLQLEINPNFIKNNFEVINWNPKKTYWFFGSRKQSTT